MLTRRVHRPRPRRGVSLIEIIIAMTLLAFVIGTLSLMSAKSARRGKDLDQLSARTFVLMEQANRFAVLPYNEIPNYASLTPTVTTFTSGRYEYQREVSYSQGTTGADYRTLKIVIAPTADLTKRDSLIFLRAKIWESSPLFIQ
jgi:prepilin-type N-terminal cleavage/methylation domain-containing protein